jgi:ornithine cyclodeaminase/alanine dehydrogenase-like protein (mu-crystallin family)
MTKANPQHPDAPATLLLSGADLAELMRPADYLAAVEQGFRAAREGRAVAPPPLHLPAIGGGFHAKAASLAGARSYAALKLNGNFPGNPGRGLPTIQGAILLCDADTGAVLAIMDSIEITLRRTAAATALAARHLANPGASTLAICGCGDQASAQVEALAGVLPLRRAFAWDIDPAKARAFAAGAAEACGLAVTAAASLREATLAADVIVTCTTARTPFLSEADVSPGAFIAAVGADNPEKSEIAPSLMAAAAVVVDVLGQCLHMGDLRHAVKAGAMSADQVRGELADVIAGARPARLSADEIVIFDSTGAALQDVASAALAYERASALGCGLAFILSPGV